VISIKSVLSRNFLSFHPGPRANPPESQDPDQAIQNPTTTPNRLIDPRSISSDELTTGSKQDPAARQDVLLFRRRRGAGGRAGAEGGGGAVPPVRRRDGPGGDGEGPQALLRPCLAVAREGPRVLCRDCGLLAPGSLGAESGPSLLLPREARCGACSRAVDPQFRFCPFCGSSL
jgi:hypothetical protein